MSRKIAILVIGAALSTTALHAAIEKLPSSPEHIYVLADEFPSFELNFSAEKFLIEKAWAELNYTADLLKSEIEQSQDNVITEGFRGEALTGMIIPQDGLRYAAMGYRMKIPLNDGKSQHNNNTISATSKITLKQNYIASGGISYRC